MLREQLLHTHSRDSVACLVRWANVWSHFGSYVHESRGSRGSC